MLQFSGLGFVTMGLPPCAQIYFCLFVCFCVVLHSCCCNIVSTVGWTWWDWSLILLTYLPSVLWQCWLGHMTRKNPSPIWPVMWDVKPCSTSWLKIACRAFRMRKHCGRIVATRRLTQTRLVWGSGVEHCGRWTMTMYRQDCASFVLFCDELVLQSWVKNFG